MVMSRSELGPGPKQTLLLPTILFHPPTLPPFPLPNPQPPFRSLIPPPPLQVLPRPLEVRSNLTWTASTQTRR